LRPCYLVWSKDGIDWVKRLVLEGEKSLFAWLRWNDLLPSDISSSNFLFQ
jgi:hypothetical protein